MVNIYNQTNTDISKNQEMYDAFNTFIFSNERNVFNKLVCKMGLYSRIQPLPGDIVECGVFKGSGVMAWLKILDMYEPNSIRKVIGLDFFNPEFIDTLDSDIDKKMMQQVFDRDQNLTDDTVSKAAITDKILGSGIGSDRFDLIAGDVCITSKVLVESRPGLRISLLYLDMDLAEPTYVALNNLWDNIVPGGIVVFDEYGYHGWSESNGADQFAKERGLQIHPFNIKAPTAFIVK